MYIKVAAAVTGMILLKFFLIGSAPGPGPSPVLPETPTEEVVVGFEAPDERSQWSLDFLAALGNQDPTWETMGVVNAWQGGENTPAKFNPLATTQDMHIEGQECFNYLSGHCGVKSYPDRQTGLDASVTTINNGNYPHMLNGLLTNNVEEFLNDTELGTWGTGRGAVERSYREWLSSAPVPQPTQYAVPAGNITARYDAPVLQVSGTGCLEPNVTSAYIHSPGLQQITIPPGADWSFNGSWVIADDQTYCPGQNFVGGGVCNMASRYSNVAHGLGLQAQSQYHGSIYDSDVPQEDNLVIMSGGGRGGQDLVILNTSSQTVVILAELSNGQLYVSGGFQ